MTSTDSDTVDWQAIKTLVFGLGVKETVFKRWLQPFVFSSQEPIALVQDAGGPCAVLAPLQAFLVKRCLEHKIPNLSLLGQDTVRGLLIEAICEVLDQCRQKDSNKPLVLTRVSRDVADILEEQEESACKRPRQELELVDVDTLHTCLTVQSFHNVKTLATFLEEQWNELMGTKYDVISFLYSVVLTKGPHKIISERGDADEALIDPLHGHGSQSLINLVITGSATQNVFDGTKDLCGLQLEGIQQQATIGFLSYLECLRYLEVGRHLKCPVWPVWVLGSETHLTVVYSTQVSLVAPPSLREVATDAFTRMDLESAGFIPSHKLGQLMSELELFCDEAYVEIMRTKLDQDSLGIILLPHFLEEFYPEIGRSNPDSFTLYHYNGLARGEGSQVRFVKGEAVMLEGVTGIPQGNAILQTLQTKWKSLAVDWLGGNIPSIN